MIWVGLIWSPKSLKFFDQWNLWPMLLALKMEERGQSQGMVEASRIREGQSSSFSLEPPERKQSADALISHPERPVLDFRPAEC